MRDVKEEHTLLLVLSAFLRAKDPIDKRERSEFPSNRRIEGWCINAHTPTTRPPAQSSLPPRDG